MTKSLLTQTTESIDSMSEGMRTRDAHKRGLEPGARILLSRQQAAFILALLVIVVAAFVISPQAALLTITTSIVAFYALFVGMKVVIGSIGLRAERLAVEGTYTTDWSAAGDDLPRYTLLVPLFRETEIFPTLVASLSSLHYPTNRLEILLLLEFSDSETRQAAAAFQLPSNMHVVIIPPVGPQTKPKACNYGLSVSNGEIVGIYDAEDIPDPFQLLKAVALLTARQLSGRRPIACAQGRLRFYNPRAGAPAPFYWGEYDVHFNETLVGFARAGLVPPLGGTSNHFLRRALDEVASHRQPVSGEVRGEYVQISGPWDPYNVTEDAALAGDLARAGFDIKMIDSVTLEEAPRSLRVAMNQRSRWIKGYIQTGFVQTRHPLSAMRAMGAARFLVFILLTLGTPLSLLLNPIVWATTAGYFLARALNNGTVVAGLESLFPGPVYYFGIALAVGGNAILFIRKLMRPIISQEYGLTKWLLLTPVWWLFTSVPAYLAVIELLQPSKRSMWRKTPHGHAVGASSESRPIQVDAIRVADALILGEADAGLNDNHVPAPAVVKAP